MVEILIWIVVATVLIVSTIQMLGSNAAFTVLSEQKLDALASAQEMIDLITAAVNNAVASGNDVIAFVTGAFPPDQFIADPEELFKLKKNGTYYHIGSSVQSVPGFGEVPGYKVTVVSYYARGKQYVVVEYFVEHQKGGPA